MVPVSVSTESIEPETGNYNCERVGHISQKLLDLIAHNRTVPARVSTSGREIPDR